MKWYRDKWLLVLTSFLGALIPIIDNGTIQFIQFFLLLVAIFPLSLLVVVRAMYLFYKIGNTKKAFTPLLYIFVYFFMQIATVQVVYAIQIIRIDFLKEELVDYYAVHQEFPEEFETSFGITYKPYTDFQSYELLYKTTYGDSRYEYEYVQK